MTASLNCGMWCSAILILRKPCRRARECGSWESRAPEGNAQLDRVVAALGNFVFYHFVGFVLVTLMLDHGWGDVPSICQRRSNWRKTGRQHHQNNSFQIPSFPGARH